MSQVIRKFENSGKIEQSKPELFERSGVGKYNKADLVAGLYRNIDTYIKNNNLSGDKAVSFRNSANQFIKGIESGSITMNGDGTFSDATGSMASTGKFDKNWIGRKKDTTNNAFNLVGDYALDYINQMQQYTEPAAKPKSKFNTNDFLTKEISKRWYGGNNIDFGNWFKNRGEQDRNALLGDIFNNADYNQLYQDYDWTDTGINSAEDLATRGKAFSTAISNNTLDNDDYNTFATLGGSGLDKFLKEAPVQTEPTPEQSRMKAWEAEAEAAGATTPEAKSAYIQRKQREEADRNAAIIKANEEDIYNRERDAFFNDYATKNPFKGTVSGYVASKTSYNPENVLQYIDTTHKGAINDYLKSALDPRYFRGQLPHQNAQGQDNLREHLANNLDLAINTGKLPKIDDETYAIPGTYNYDNWSLVTYNPVSRQYKETSMLANDALKKIAYAEYDRRKKTPTNKEGGVIKLQYGGFVEDDSAYNAYREELPTTFKNWYSLKRVTQGTPSVSKGVDFSTMDLRRATSDGKVLEPHPLSNEGIWEYMVNNSWGKSFKKPDIGKNWGYRPYKPETNNAPASEWDTFKSDLESKAKTRIKKKQYEQALAEQDKKDLRKIRTATTAKNKREQYSSSMADDAIALKYWRKRYPKRTAGLSDNDLLDLIEQQKVASRDPQGRLKFNAGGVVQFLQDGKTVGRIKAKDMSNWNRAQALTGYDWGADFDRWASSHDSPDDVVDSYITSFNGGEDIYDQLTSKTGDYFGGKYNYSVQDPLAKHRQVTFRGTNQGFDDLIRKGIVGYGTTEGDSGFDIYAGDRTGNRTLGRGLSAEDVTRFNKQLQSRGMELYDKGNGAYRLRRFEQKPVELPEVVATAPKAPTNPTAVTPAASKKGKGFNLGVMPEDVIALGRMVGGLAANNRAAKLYKEGLKPTLLDTFENTVPLQGNFQAKTNAEQQAGNLESVAARPRTSDASLQLAGELEASDRAGQARFQGGLQDAEMFYKTRMLGQQESDAAKGRRVEVANRNRASMNQIDAAKKQINAARITSNYQNVIAPYLAGVENQFAQKRAMNQQLDMEEAQRLAERTYSPEFDRLTEDYNTAYKAYGDANKNDYTGWQTSNEYKSLLNRRKTLNDNVSQFLLDKRRGIMGSPYMFQFKGSSSTKTPYVKSGGKLSAADREKLQRAKDFNKRLLEDNKQFHKDIMESKREHNKLIMSMSSLTSELIKKAMS